jgi:regulator of nucleoside diphosphate kinase
MKRQRTIINEIDKSRLTPYLQSAWDGSPTARLRETLELAESVPPNDVPPDVVTMNSQLAIRYPEDDEVQVCTLSYPYEENDSGISVLSPLGSALLAAREGERVDFMGARHWRAVIVEAIEYQPERVGRFDL